MQRYLVTGGAGFIGSNFVHLLLRERPESRVVVLDKLTYAGNLANLGAALADNRVRFVQADIADADAVTRVMRDAPIDFIVNFAAETHVDRSVLEPSSFITTNVQGVHVLLEAARAHGVRRMLHVSTDEVYGAVLTGQSYETDALHTRSPYSAAKAGGDLLAVSYAVTYGLDVVITRGANTIGPCQYPEKATPLFITNAIDDLPLPIYGDGKNVRDYLFVEDHCRAILTALERGEPGAIYNIGNNLEIDTLTLAEAILERLGKPRSLIRLVTDRPGHDRRYAVNSDKLRRLGWAPEHDFAATITRTVAWYVEHQAWWRAIRSGDFQQFYQRQYGERLGLRRGTDGAVPA